MVVTVYINTKENHMSIKNRICDALKDAGTCSLILDGDRDCICYLLYECSGEYEDYYERIVYASLERKLVENKKQKFEVIEQQKMQQYEKCFMCPVEELTKRKLKNHRHEVEEYCDEFEPECDGNECWCNNMRSYHDPYTYRIKEVKLEWD